MEFIQYGDRIFLEKERPVLHELISSHTNAMRAKWQEEKEKLKEEFFQVLTGLYNTYKDMQHDNRAEEVRFIYISFLRTGVLLNRDFYRIDLYDGNGQLSQIECAGNWQPAFLAKRMREAREKLEKDFTNRGIPYILDEMILQFGEELNKAFIPLFKEIFAGCETGMKSERIFWQPVQVCIGEFLDSSEEIYWGGL